MGWAAGVPDLALMKHMEGVARHLYNWRRSLDKNCICNCGFDCITYTEWQQHLDGIGELTKENIANHAIMARIANL